MEYSNCLKVAFLLAVVALSAGGGHALYAADKTSESWLKQGKVLQRQGDAGAGARYYREAQSAYRKALKLEPANIQAANGLASVLMRLGNTIEAADVVKRALKISPDSPVLYARLAYIARYAGYLDISIQAYRRSERLDNSPKNRIRVREQLAKAYIYQGQHKESLRLFEEIAALSKQHDITVRGKTFFYAGLSLLYLDEPVRARTYFKQAVVKEKGSLWGQFAAGYERLAAKDKKGVKDVANALALDTANIADGERRYRMVHLAAAAGEVDGALEHFDRAVAAGNFNYPYFADDLLTRALRDSHRFQRILAQADKLHKNFPAIDLPQLK
ncbi:tetratricopeptide repeat protein [Exilibacterium tricleocarpae]|uniref:Tetratricopeptide repeat protein n=1 Tax=Exilibacterium tricleocarpae TaxID=2591008 RepID=A0A545SS02_9GAMM|nr:tetratricopeptide repeat protein [Exilibacterium tricleocarpae]TQV67747.1 tetratricopeptide repeat protein [Exilibacterium tricleocarpae]